MLLLIYILLSFIMLAVIYLDVTRYTIPNKLNLLFLLLYPVFVLLSPQWLPSGESIDYMSGIYAMLVVFAVGYVIFVFNIMGGGDVKLLTVCALWLGLDMVLLEFMVYMALLGGALSVLMVFGRPVLFWCAGKVLGSGNIPRLFEKGAPLPYGIAIAVAFLFVLWRGDISGLPLPW